MRNNRTGLETYLTNIIKDAVREVVKEELESFRSTLQQPKEKRQRNNIKQEKKKSEFQEKGIIRPKELAEYLSVSISTLYKMKNNGELPPQYQISSRAVGWLKEEIDEWMEANKI